MKKGCTATCMFHGLIIAGLITAILIMSALENSNVVTLLARRP